VDWIKCIVSRLRRAAWRREAGVTLIETVMAISLFGIVSVALIGVLTSATAADGLARQRSIALELAQQQVEYVRQLNYANAGVQTGNPNGVVAGSQVKSVMGLWYRLSTSIRWVNDPVQGIPSTAANYKRVRVVVYRNSDSKELARAYTYLSSSRRAQYGGINNAIINAKVLDNVTNTPVPGATVAISNGPSPTSNASDTTDDMGLVTFSALTPNPANSYYDVMVSLQNYYTLRENLPPGCNGLQTCTSPAPAPTTPEVTPAHIQLAASEATNTTNETFMIYKPSTITINIFNSDGVTPYSGAATVIVGSQKSAASGQLFPRGVQEYTVNGGSATIGPSQASPFNMVGGEYPVSGVKYMVGARTSGNLFAPLQNMYVPCLDSSCPGSTYPANPFRVFNLTLGSSALTTKSCTITVKNSSGQVVSGARVDAVDGANDPLDSYFTGTTNGSGQVVFNLPAGGIDWDIYADNGMIHGHLADRQIPSSGSCPGSTSSSSPMYLTIAAT
jgi:type II secretory pathway pseudopilin PulG